MRFKGVFLDIDNTLYEYEPAHRVAVEAATALLARRLRVGPRRLRAGYEAARAEVNGRLAGTAASHNRMLYFQRMLESLGVNPLEHALPAYSAYWDGFLAHIRLSDDARFFLKRIQKAKVCLITDLTAHIQHRKAVRLGLGRIAAAIVTSEEAGREKPHPAIYRMALKKVGLLPKDVCMVGDSFGKDILGATRLGIRGFWLNRRGESRSLGRLAVSVRDLRELAEMLL